MLNSTTINCDTVFQDICCSCCLECENAVCVQKVVSCGIATNMKACADQLLHEGYENMQTPQSSNGSLALRVTALRANDATTHSVAGSLRVASGIHAAADKGRL